MPGVGVPAEASPSVSSGYGVFYLGRRRLRSELLGWLSLAVALGHLEYCNVLLKEREKSSIKVKRSG